MEILDKLRSVARRYNGRFPFFLLLFLVDSVFHAHERVAYWEITGLPAATRIDKIIQYTY